MPSTFSTNLRLELQATGENSSTWGNIANTQFQLLEAAVAGYTSIAMSDANLTLTASNGASDQARQMALRFTGTLTTARDIVVPSVSKVYVIHNATTGGFALNVKTSGGASAVVANGSRALVLCDGTDCFFIIANPSTIPTIGTSGATVGLLNANKTDSGNNTFSGTNQFATIDIGNADTTLSRVSAGVIAVEGGTVPLENRANTFASSVVQMFSGLVIANRTTATANPDNSGSATTNIQARLGASNVGSGGYGIDIGVSNADGSVWVQARDWSNFATNSTLRLQPNGGIVTIGGNTAYHAGNLPGTNVNWTTAQTFSAASQQIINRTDSGIYHVEMRGAGTTRGYIGADATYAFRVYNGAATECFRVTHSSGLSEFIFQTQFNSDAYFQSATAPASTLSVGYRGVPQIGSASGSITITQTNYGGCEVRYTGTGGHTWTFDPSLPDAQVIMIRNDGTGNLTLAPGAGYTMRLDGGLTTGNRTLVPGGTAMVRKRNTQADMIVSGAGVS